MKLPFWLNKTTVIFIELSILIIVIILCGFWVYYPQGTYEATIVLLTTIGLLIEFVRRKLPTEVQTVGLSGWCEAHKKKWKIFVKNPSVNTFYDCVIYVYSVENCNAVFTDTEIVFGTVPPQQTLKDNLNKSDFKNNGFGLPLVALEYTDSQRCALAKKPQR